MNLTIKNGRVIDPDNGTDEVRDLFVSDGCIQDPNAAHNDSGNRVLDATGLIVCPGLIDLQARLREPGEEHKATMFSELNAAVSAGVTSVCCPADTEPVIDTPAMVHMVRQRAGRIERARVYPLGALTRDLAGERLTDMAALAEAGCVGVGNADRAVESTLVMRRAMQYASNFDLTVFLNALDPWLKGNGCVHEGEISTRLGLPVIPEAAETVALARELALIETTGVRGHICQLSCARSVEKLAEAQQRGLPVSAAVSAHHLHLNERDIGDFDTRCHVLPPLRSITDRDALRQGLADGVIQAVCSDHQPHGTDAKLAPFSESASGIAGLETLLSLMLRLVDKDVLTLSKAIAAVTSNPAKILGIDLGQLGLGATADICIFDPDAEHPIDAQNLQSNGTNTPFDGWTLRGTVRWTLVAGKVVNDQVTSKN
jgi:dihydroorotase